MVYAEIFLQVGFICMILFSWLNILYMCCQVNGKPTTSLKIKEYVSPPPLLELSTEGPTTDNKLMIKMRNQCYLLSLSGLGVLESESTQPSTP